MKYYKKLIVIFVVLILLTGCGQSSGSGGGSAPAGAFGGPDSAEDTSIAVEIMKAEPTEAIRKYQTIGQLIASEQVTVSGSSSGKVQSINYDVGDVVKKGDTLYTLDSSDLENDLSLSKSQYEKSLEDAERTFTDAQKDFANVKTLYESGAASEVEYDNALNTLNQAESNYEQAKKELNSYEYSSQSSLDDTIIQSPIDGVVAGRNIEVGEMTASQDFVIVKIDPIVVETSVSSEFVNQIAVNDEAMVTVQNKEYTGSITLISPIGENGSNIYPVEVELSNEQNILKPGMFAEVSLEVAKAQNQIFLPKKAVLSDDEKSYVYVAENNEPKRVTVEKGFTQDGMVQILNGLKEGDQVIVKGQEYITQGATIRIVN